jgi:hypothetical protein
MSAISNNNYQQENSTPKEEINSFDIVKFLLGKRTEARNVKIIGA